jgi:surfeit locus 1 family protein
VAGVFEHEHERHFFATWKGQSGFYVYTPLKLDDGRRLLVNRGFTPYELKDPATRPAGQVERRVEVTGLAREPLAEKPSFVVPENDEAENIFYWKDRDRMAASVGLALGDENLVPFFVDAAKGAVPGGWPVGGVTIIDLPNNHLQYAMTWFGLAGTLLVVAAAWFWRRRA